MKTIKSILLVGFIFTQFFQLAHAYGGTASLNKNLLDAASSGDLSGVKAFLPQGAEVEAKNDVGNTALILAARGGHPAIVNFLLEKGANIEAKNNGGNTALIYAADSGRHPEIVKILIANGAYINAKNNSGETALDRATIPSTVDHSEVIRLLKK